MTFPYVTSYVGHVIMEIMIKAHATWLNNRTKSELYEYSYYFN